MLEIIINCNNDKTINWGKEEKEKSINEKYIEATESRWLITSKEKVEEIGIFKFWVFLIECQVKLKVKSQYACMKAVPVSLQDLS